MSRWGFKACGVEVLKDKTLASIVKGNTSDYNKGDGLVFTTDNGEVYEMYHDQDCCESVTLEDIAGDLEDLIGSPILQAEESSDHTDEEDHCQDGSQTWTFYKFATVKGFVTLRWYGSSNGYYSEDVSFYRTK